MMQYDVEELYDKLGLFGNFQIFVVVMYTIGERVTAGLLDFQVFIFQNYSRFSGFILQVPLTFRFLCIANP